MKSVEQDVPRGQTFLAVGDMSIFALLRCYCGHSVKNRLWGKVGIVKRLLQQCR